VKATGAETNAGRKGVNFGKPKGDDFRRKEVTGALKRCEKKGLGKCGVVLPKKRLSG